MKRLLLTATILGFGVSFQAQADDSIYLRGDLGISMMRDATGKLTESDGSKTEVKYDFKKKAIWGIGVGYQFSDLVRADFTVQHQNIEGSGLIYNNGTTAGATGKAEASATSYMVNGYLELAPLLEMDGPFKPFVGAGLGMTTHDVDKIVSSTGVIIVGDTTNDFTWRLAAGTGYDLTDNLSLNVEYAFMNMGKAKASPKYLNSNTNPLDTPETKMQSHNLLVGLRYKF